MTKPEKDALRELLNIAPYGLNSEVRSKNPNLVNSLVATLTGYNLMPYYIYLSNRNYWQEEAKHRKAAYNEAENELRFARDSIKRMEQIHGKL